MKTVEQLIFEKRFKDAEFDPNEYNDWAKENEYEAYTLCLAVAKQLQQHVVSSKQPLCQCGQNSLPYDAIHKVKTCSRCGAACDHAKGW